MHVYHSFFQFFHKEISEAVRHNTRSLDFSLELLTSCKKLKAIVYLSTCYVNSDMPHDTVVEEQVRDRPNLDVEEILALSDEQINNRPELMQGCDNHYIFSKVLSEQVSRPFNSHLQKGIE